ncbi:MAG: hypothetical protein JWR02_989 [Mucilaginibacter sp.]|nr:hypothetical protein [Mucilaginibacter sp.]
MKNFTQITKILFTLLISVFIRSAALAQCVLPVFTSIGNSGPVCQGGTLSLNAAGTVGGVSSGFIRMAGIGANDGNRAFDQVFSSGDRAGSIARITNAQFDAIFAGQPTDAARAAALKAKYDVLMFTWASPTDNNINWGLITAYLSTGGSVFVDGDYNNVYRLNDGTSNSVNGFSTDGSYGCSYQLVSPAPFPTLVANGVNGCFENHHLMISTFPSWMKTYIAFGSQNLAVAGIYPAGNGGRLIVQGPDQDFHAFRGGNSTERNQYQICLNQIDFLKANQSGITWTGPNGFTSNDANATITNVTAANAGVYTATLTNITGGGCSVTATTTVVVTPTTPTITAASPTNICAGSSVTLTASAGTSYHWSNGATTQSIEVSTAGNYTVTVTNTGGCSGTSAPTDVTVNPLPIATASNSGPVTSGATINLAAAGGDTYSWTGPNSFTSTLQNPSIANATTANAGTYTVTVSHNGCTATSSTVVVVNTIPGGALSFNGSNYVNINNPFTAYGKEITVEWTADINPSNPLGTGIGQSTFNIDGANSMVWLMHYVAPNIEFYISDNGTWKAARAAVPPGWHHWTGVANATGIYLYMDGTLVNTNANGVSGAILNVPGSVINLGKDVRYATGRFFTGKMDEVRIWSRALCAGEIQNNVNGELSGPQTGLEEYYKLNQGNANDINTTVTTAVESSGNNRTGTLVNFDLTGTASNWIPGAITATAPPFVQPTATVTASGPLSFCPSGSVVFTANTGSGLSYEWLKNNNGIIGANSATYTATDSGTYNVIVTNNGCSATSADQVVVVQDLNPPVFTSAQANIIVALDATGNAFLADYASSATATDNCILSGITQFPAAGTALVNNVPATVTLTATDPSGNKATQSFTVTATDQTPPVLSTKNITVYLDASGNATITPASVDNGSTDNVGITTYSLDKSAFDCTSVGANTVNLTVSDAAGNQTSGSAIVTVQDTTKPAAIAQNITVQLDATGNVTITPAQINNGSTDNCAIATYALDKTAFDCSTVGTNTVTLTVTDTHGNVSTTTAVVTVQDNIPPIAIAQNITVQLDATGKVTITPEQINNGSTDNCAIGTYALNKSTFDCSNFGANTVTLTVTDIHGNASVATAVVTVQDNVPPIAIAQAITVQLDATGKATITPAQINNGSTDNCAIATYTLNKLAFDCSNVGPNTVTLTVTDIHGNAAAATAVVTVQDNIPPTALAQNLTVQLDASGKATITPAQINNGSTDNCTISTYTLDKSAFTCSNVGPNTVILTVTDVNGNASTATAIVTVQDNIKPTAIAQNITVQLDATGKVTITPSQVNNGSFDNCAIADYALDKISFDCSNVGTNNVTLTVTDTHGNVSTALAVVTVQDNVPPVVLTKNITVYLSGGNATIIPAQVDNGSNDACGIKSMSLDKTTFDCSTQGANTVTLTVTDNHGNVSTGTASVTVIGKTPTPSIAVSRADNTSTKLDANTIALGYGAQKLTLTASNPNSAPGASTFKWSPSAGLSNANIANPVFTPTQAGSYTFNVLVTSEYGCQASASVTITVIDARCGNDDKVSVCHNTGSSSNPYTQLCISANAVAVQLANGGTLGTCATPILAKTRTLEVTIPEAPKVVTLIAYPNPFGKRTTVSFTVPSAEQNVTLDVYDTMGRKVASLYSGKAEAGQTYSYPFDGTRLMFGVYFVRLTTSTGAYTFRLSMLE